MMVSVSQTRTYVRTEGTECILDEFLCAPDQIQQREQEDPYNIDEVPIQAADFHRREIVGVELALPRHCVDCEHQDHAHKHVNGVEAGHEEIEAEQNLGLPGVLSLI